MRAINAGDQLGRCGRLLTATVGTTFRTEAGAVYLAAREPISRRSRALNGTQGKQPSLAFMIPATCPCNCSGAESAFGNLLRSIPTIGAKRRQLLSVICQCPAAVWCAS